MLTTTGIWRDAEELQEAFMAELDTYGPHHAGTATAYRRWQCAVERAGGSAEPFDSDRWAEVARRRREYRPTAIERWIRNRTRQETHVEHE